MPRGAEGQRSGAAGGRRRCGGRARAYEDAGAGTGASTAATGIAQGNIARRSALVHAWRQRGPRARRRSAGQRMPESRLSAAAALRRAATSRGSRGDAAPGQSDGLNFAEMPRSVSGHGRSLSGDPRRSGSTPRKPTSTDISQLRPFLSDPAPRASVGRQGSPESVRASRREARQQTRPALRPSPRGVRLCATTTRAANPRGPGHGVQRPGTRPLRSPPDAPRSASSSPRCPRSCG